MTAIIVEDEFHSAEVLQTLITSYCSDVVVIDICAHVLGAIQSIQKHKPDIVFLDILLADGNGFDVLNAISLPYPQLIITTAYDDFAIKAFKYSALDYLLKPISIKELQAAVNKAQHGKHILPDVENMRQFFSTILRKEKLQKLAIPLNDGHIFLPIEDILYLAASGSYTNIYTENQRPFLVSKSLKEYENLLAEEDFIRIHHSHIANIHHIRRYIKGAGGQVLLSDGTLLDVSVRKKEDLLFRLNIHT